MIKQLVYIYGKYPAGFFFFVSHLNPVRNEECIPMGMGG